MKGEERKIRHQVDRSLAARFARHNLKASWQATYPQSVTLVMLVSPYVR